MIEPLSKASSALEEHERNRQHCPACDAAVRGLKLWGRVVHSAEPLPALSQSFLGPGVTAYSRGCGCLGEKAIPRPLGDGTGLQLAT